MIKVNYSNTKINKDDLLQYRNKIKEIDKSIKNKTCKGSDFLGWHDLPKNYNFDELSKIKLIAESIQNKNVEYLVVIGIGGSYLGALSAYDMIKGNYSSDQYPKMIFAGHNISSVYLNELSKYLENRSFAICVVSKSGGTLEPTIAFSYLEKQLIRQVGETEAAKLIVAVTDKEKGVLKEYADKKNYPTFVVPDDIGGRYSVLTPVGLVPLAICGINIDNMIKGSEKAYNDLKSSDMNKNDAYLYAALRYHFYKKLGFRNEIMVNYEPSMNNFSEWWKQLFGESEGKEEQGLMPLSMVFSTDLHSLGQMLQEGNKELFFETVIHVEKVDKDIIFKDENINLNTLPYLKNRSLKEINDIALKGVINAHFIDGKINNLILKLDNISDEMYGYLAYFMFKACAMSALLLEVNPFNQPGVQNYKSNINKELGI